MPGADANPVSSLDADDTVAVHTLRHIRVGHVVELHGAHAWACNWACDRACDRACWALLYVTKTMLKVGLALT